MIINFNQPIRQEQKIIDASVATLTYYPSVGYQSIQSVQVNGVTAFIDSNIIPTNIRQGTTILGVAGTIGSSLQDKTVNAQTTTVTVAADLTYGGLNTVTIPGVTASIDSNIVSGNIKNGVQILGVNGTYIAGGTWYGAGKDVRVAKDNTIHTGELIDLKDTTSTQNYTYFSVYNGQGSHLVSGNNEMNQNTVLSDFDSDVIFASFKAQSGTLRGSIYEPKGDFLVNQGIQRNCEISISSTATSQNSAIIKENGYNFVLYGTATQLVATRTYMSGNLLALGETSALATISGVQNIAAVPIPDTSPQRYLVTYTTTNDVFAVVVTISGINITAQAPLSIKPFASAQTYNDLQVIQAYSAGGVDNFDIGVKYTGGRLAFVRVQYNGGTLTAPTKLGMTVSSGDIYAEGFRWIKLNNSRLILVYGSRSGTVTLRYCLFNSQTGVAVGAPTVIDGTSLGNHLELIELPSPYSKYRSFLLVYGNISNTLMSAILQIEGIDSTYENTVYYSIKNMATLNSTTGVGVRPRAYLFNNTVYLAHSNGLSNYLSVTALELNRQVYAQKYTNTIKAVSAEENTEGNFVRVFTPNVRLGYNVYGFAQGHTSRPYNTTQTIGLTADLSHYPSSSVWISSPDGPLVEDVDFVAVRSKTHLNLVFAAPIKSDLLITAAAEKFFSITKTGSPHADITWISGGDIKPEALYYGNTLNVTAYSSTDSFQQTPTLNGQNMTATQYKGRDAYHTIGHIIMGDVSIATCTSEQSCAGCLISCQDCQSECESSCQICVTCQGCDGCEGCDTCLACQDACQECEGCDECDVCDDCDTCQVCDINCDTYCEINCLNCEHTCEWACEGCDSGCQDCEVCDACDYYCEDCDTCQSCNSGDCSICMSCEGECGAQCDEACQECDTWQHPCVTQGDCCEDCMNDS